MKKVLSILGTISLSIIISTNVIACKKPNENNKHNKLNEPTETKFIPQKPPENSDGKLVTDYNYFENNIDNKYYFVIGKNTNNKGKIEKFKNDTSDVKKIGEVIYIHSIKYYAKNNNLKGLYRGDGNYEPTTPTINEDTGEIINGNEK